MHHKTPPPILSIVVPTHNTRELVLVCLASIPAEANIEAIVVDDGSEDGTASEIGARFPWVTLIRNESPRGFTAAVNRGIRSASAPCILLLNSDTELLPGALPALLAAFQADPAVGIAGGELKYPDGTRQWSGGPEPGLPWLFVLASGLPALLERFPGYRHLRPPAGHSGRNTVAWVSGAALALRRDVWEQVGPLDEGFRFYCQDLDLCLRARESGWKVVIVLGFRVIHHHGATIGRTSGSLGACHPQLLWGDLVRWARKHRGSRGARQAAGALRLGGALRLLGLSLRLPWLASTARESWQQENRAYRNALAAIAEAIDEAPAKT